MIAEDNDAVVPIIDNAAEAWRCESRRQAIPLLLPFGGSFADVAMSFMER